MASLIFIIVGLSTGLSIGLIYGLSSALSFGLINGLSYGLSAGLSAGLSYWVLFGVYQGIVQERIEDRDRRTFNRRIRRSLRNGAFISLASGGFIGGIGILSAGLSIVLSIVLSAGLNNWLDTGPYYPAPSVTLSAELGDILSYGLRLGWFIAISGGLLVWAMIGGLTVLRHYALRFLLARSRTFPWRAQAFLDDATARILLRRVDGGYSFVHRRLLDFFATADAPTPEKQDEGEKEHAPVQSLSTASDVQ